MTAPDLTTHTWLQLAALVEAIWGEAKRRNPILINAYQAPFVGAAAHLREIATAEKRNPTSEHGPGAKPATHWRMPRFRGKRAFCGTLITKTMNASEDRLKVTCQRCVACMVLHGHLSDAIGYDYPRWRWRDG